MSSFLDFAAALAPSLLGFARDLFETHKGDAEAARIDIEDRRAEIRANRAKVDADLAKKHGG